MSKKLILFLFLILFLPARSTHADTTSSAAAAAAASAPSYSSLSSQFGSVQGSITDSGSCISASGFLVINATPLSDGDDALSVTLNGTNYSIPLNDTGGGEGDGISGVCSNGFIVCSSGSWSNCAYYGWGWNGTSLTEPQTANPAPQQVAVNQMATNGYGGTTQSEAEQGYSLQDCQCINASCAGGGMPLSQASTTQQEILSQLGAGIIGALGNANSGMVIGSAAVNSNNTQISYNGYNSATCGGNQNSGNNTSLYNSGGNSLASEVPSSSMGNTDSSLGNIYFGGNTATGTLNNIQNETFGSSTPDACQVQNNVSFNQKITYSSSYFYPAGSGTNEWDWSAGGACEQAGNDTCCSTQNSIAVQDNNPSASCSDGCIGGINIGGAALTGYGTCSGTIPINPTTGITPGVAITCQPAGCNAGGSLSFSGNGDTISVSGSLGGNAQISSSFQYYPVYSQPVNSCSALENNSNCKLQTKQVCDQNDSNCYTIVSNFNVNQTPSSNGSAATCPTGYALSGNECVETVPQSYTCPAGYTLSGSSCAETIPAGTTCPDAGALSGTTTCTLPATLSCPAGSAASGSLCILETAPDYTNMAYVPGYSWTVPQTDQNQGAGTIEWTVNMSGTDVNVTPSETADTTGYGTLATSSAPYGGEDFPYVNETFQCHGANSYNFSAVNSQETSNIQNSSVSGNTVNTYNSVNGVTTSTAMTPTTLTPGVYYCSFLVSQLNTSVSNTATMQNNTQTQVSGNPNSNTVEYASCAESSSEINNTCISDPNNSSEYLCCTPPSGSASVSPCNDNAQNVNQNNLVNAVVEMTLMDKAANDMICTQN